jgi:hypothetical protein
MQSTESQLHINTEENHHWIPSFRSQILFLDPDNASPSIDWKLIIDHEFLAIIEYKKGMMPCARLLRRS